MTTKRNPLSRKNQTILVISTVVMLVSIIIMSQAIGALFAIFYGLFSDAEELNATANFVIYVGFVTATLGAVYWVQSKHHHKPKTVAQSLGFKRPRLSNLWQAFIGYGQYFVLLLATFFVLDYLNLFNTDQDQMVGFEGSLGFEKLLAFIALVVLTPIAEEILFRGFFYLRMRKLVGVWPAAVVTSVLFGLVHFQINVAIDTFLLSMVMIYAFEQSKNLTVPILIHAIKNSLAFIILFNQI